MSGGHNNNINSPLPLTPLSPAFSPHSSPDPQAVAAAAATTAAAPATGSPSLPPLFASQSVSGSNGSLAMSDTMTDPESVASFSANSAEPMEVVLSTRELFNEGQKMAYAGLVYIASQDGYEHFDAARFKSVHVGLQAYGKWAQRIMLRLYQHLDIAEQERRVIERMPKHGVLPQDLASSLIPEVIMQQHRLQQQQQQQQQKESCSAPKQEDVEDASATTLPAEPANQPRSTPDELPKLISRSAFLRENPDYDDLPKGMLPASASAEAAFGVSQVIDTPGGKILTTPTTVQPPLVKLTKADIRHAVISDLFLLCIADYNYDARSRSLIHAVARYLLVPYDQVVAIEITFAMQLQFIDGVNDMKDLSNTTDKRARERQDQKRRYVALAAATVGGGIVLGLSAGLAAPLIGAGLGAAFTGIGLTGTTAFLSGTGGVALITTGATMAGSGIAGRKMANRTRGISEFTFLPVHEAKRTSVVITVGGWLAKTDEQNSDICVPFSVVDASMGDHYSVLWEPDTLRELGSALKILAGEVLSTAVQQALMVTMLHSLLAALAWPLALTKMGYLIDNPWQNALARSKKAGQLLADLLIKRVQEARPVTLIGFSLGARVIYYCLLELARSHAYGLVEAVYLFGCPVTGSEEDWHVCRTVVSGRFVNGSVKNDWILGFLFRATSGGFSRVAGLGGCNVPGIEEVDLTSMVNGHLMYRVHMPQILKHCGVCVNTDDLEFLSKKDERVQAAQEEKERVMKDIREREKSAKKRKNRWDVLNNLRATNNMSDLPDTASPVDGVPSASSSSSVSSPLEQQPASEPQTPLSEAVSPHRRSYIEDIPADCPVKEIKTTLSALVISEDDLHSGTVPAQVPLPDSPISPTSSSSSFPVTNLPQ
ncbi:hypothetical protein RI367_007873 [Sorochytrium milnesiophthora]